MLQVGITAYFLFAAAVLGGLYCFFKAAPFHGATVIGLLVWVVAQSVLAATGFYTVTDAFPPRFPALVIPPVFAIGLLFVTSRGRSWIASLRAELLTLLHVIRLPIELTLYLLFVARYVPQSMTFEGRNFDILSGLMAPLVYYFGYVRLSLPRWAIVAWNLLGIGLLTNVVATAVQSVPGPLQTQSFDQPNVAVLYFPFVLLPALLVPLVLLAHSAVLYQLATKPKNVVS